MEKFSEYADVKQLLLERVAGKLQHVIESRAEILRLAKLGVPGGGGRPIVYTHDNRHYIHDDDVEFPHEVSKALQAAEDRISAALIDLKRLWSSRALDEAQGAYIVALP